MEKCFTTRNNDQWATPSNIYNKIINEMGYTDFNPLCINYENSLNKIFKCDLFCNPPFSNIEPFVDYMLEHQKKGYNVVMLLPSRTGTKWFKKLVQNELNTSIYFFTQRLHFNDSNSAPFDTMLVFMSPSRMPIHTIGFINRDMEIVK